MTQRTCLIDGCEKPAKGRGWCGMHYARWRKHGDTHTVHKNSGKRGRRHKDLDAHILSMTERVGSCLMWQGAITNNGYGVLHTEIDGQRYHYAHRVSYRVFTGEIPEGMQIDHMCHNRACVEPTHLRLATNAQNHENLRAARSDSRSGIRGAIWSTQKGKWAAIVYAGGKRHHGGFFSTAAEAGRVAEKMRGELHTHHFDAEVIR